MVYRKSSIKPPGVPYFSLEVRINRDRRLIGEGGAGLLNLEKTMVSVLHKEERIYKVEKLKYKKVGGQAGRGSESNPIFQVVNKSSPISPQS